MGQIPERIVRAGGKVLVEPQQSERQDEPLRPSVPAPQRIELHTDPPGLQIEWNATEVSRVAGDVLRSFCPCAQCRVRQTMGMRLVTDNAHIDRVDLIGRNGLQITFGDGHNRGIYPWPYLYAIGLGRAQELLA